MNNRPVNGFSLIEMIATLLVVGIVLAVGVPSFNQFMANSRMAAVANDMVTAMHAARTEAIKRNQVTTICPSADGATCAAAGELEIGWIGFVDCTAVAGAGPCIPNGVVDGADTVFMVHDALPANILFDHTLGARMISFNANGSLATLMGGVPLITDIQLCDDRGNVDTGGGIAAGRWVQISPTGRPRIFRDQNTIQGGANPLPGC